MHSPRNRQRSINGIQPAFSLIVAPLLMLIVAVPFAMLPRSRGLLPAPPAAPPPAPQVETRIPIEGVDANHRRVPFTVYVLSDQLSWKMESVTDLEGGQTLLNPELRDEIHRARDVLCIGTASSEGNTAKEEARALHRAESLVRWIGAVIPESQGTRLITVNAGQYRGPKELESTNQRKAIIIVTEGYDEGANLSQALTAGLKKKQQEYPIVYSLLHDYSRSSQWLRLVH